MSNPAKFVGTAIINGKDVSFFTPPHSEPDFLWVDVEELAKAFLPRAAARKMVALSQKFEQENRLAKKDGKIRTIMCHAMAQGMLGSVDQILHGYTKLDEEWGGGPSETAYCVAAGKMMYEHSRLPFDQLFKAFHNQGGPFMREMRDE
ncbi:MAG: hypothetical protein PGN22_02740 [Agrobacterium cavarae]